MRTPPRINLPLCAALANGISIYLFARQNANAVEAVIIGFCPAALGIALLFCNGRGAKRMCCTCIACAFGLFFGFSQMMVLEVQHSRYGGIYRLDSYSQYRIVLSSDSSVTRNKKSLIRGRLVSGGTADGNSGTLCGSVLVISSSLEAYCWGQHLLITAPLSEAPKTDKAAPSREIHYISYANQDEIREEGWNNTFYEIRAALLEQLRHCCRALSPETEGFLLALLLGIRDRLPAHVREFFVLSGCMHILALSGMHLGILVSGLVFLTANIFGRRVSGICGICFTAFYLFLVGLKPSLLRAAIMFFLASTARTCGKRSSACALLSLTFLISAWCFTRDLFSLSFQFSYAALAGIIVLGKRLYFLIRGSLPPVIASPLCAAVAAQSATAFLAVGSFGSLYPVGIIAAILLTPLIVVFICEGILFLIISITGLPWLIRIVNDIIEWTFFLIRTTVSFFSQCPFLSIPERYAFLIFLIPVIMVCYLYIFPNGTVKRQTDD